MNAPDKPPAAPPEDYVGACVRDPDRWTTEEPDTEAKALCRACLRRFRCAYDGWNTPNASGLLAGVVVPEEPGRPRDFALRRLHDLAEHGGYPVRPRRRGRQKFTR